ncbi:hypothetical protein BDV12DRAFT_122501 [Aspergillus spectabilis]
MSSITLDLPGVALVTGAGGGIGAATAKAFAVAGCHRIIITDLRTTETSVEAFDRINRVNYRSVWLCSRAAFAQMIKQEALPQHPGQKGAVANIASQLGVVARAGAAPYCASKAAIINMTREDAIDYSQDSIRVNCVCPGVIATSMATGSPDRAEHFKPAVEIAPMKRMGTSEEVANSFLFLCSPLRLCRGMRLLLWGIYN